MLIGLIVGITKLLTYQTTIAHYEVMAEENCANLDNGMASS